MTSTPSRTLFEKIWRKHVVTQKEDIDLLYIDRCLLDESSNHVFTQLARNGHTIRRPRQIFAFADHYVPSINRHLPIEDSEIRSMVELIDRNSIANGIAHFGLHHPLQGIMHVVAPELGLTWPGIVMTGTDSHTSTHGAFGALAFGVGTSEAAHVLATQSLWQRRPKTMQIEAEGDLPFGVTAKDIILSIIARIGIGGASGHVIEYTGSAIRSLSMEARMTICNMSIEAGARAGLIAPDEATFAFLKGRPYAPKDGEWERSMAEWRLLSSDVEARFDRSISIDAAKLEPMVTWGTNPEHALAIGGLVPDPVKFDAIERRDIEATLKYMALTPGTRLVDIAVDRVFIGSCTNARLEDLRSAAEVAKLGRAVVPTWVVPGSTSVRRAAEAEGLDRIFISAGFEWRHSGCSLCTAINGDTLKPGERCASTSNRNFQGRQGVGGRTHLMSPAMAAAAALTGRLTDVRALKPKR